MIGKLFSLVKFEHTIFALPFAYAGMMLAAEAASDGNAHKAITVSLVIWITIAMVAARTLAMGLNRLIDHAIDARNPRTASRELPAGTVKRAQVWTLCLVSLALLVIATTQLEPITRLLWPIPVALFVLYPYTKRFTWLCHLVLGLSIGLAPLAAWLATVGDVTTHASSWPMPLASVVLVPFALWIGIAFWIGGFDVIYATADIEFDQSAGITSLPVRFGLRGALNTVRVAHTITIACFAAVGVLASLNFVFWIALTVAAALLVWENTIVNAKDLSRIDHAFFTVNSYVGVILGVGVMVGVI